ncbi:cation diffusion facilitator family transporter [Halorhodospira halochloris]|uniref:cation diffusion facilitator family transporter n=1 Tax=Halorhodospira halochloris TaxID=1052 RepID=UPI001EE79F60|nr:cation diffusion facilitator family transporter [Halorhodospira halochloris]
MSSSQDQPEQATAQRSPARAKRKVTLIGAATNLLLGAGKIVAGYIGQSQALIVDGIHSLSDLLSDAMVLLAASYGSQEADSDHPYGHARIETAATAGVGAILLLVAAGFIYDAINRLLIDPTALLIPGWLALVVAVGSLVVKEALYHYTQAVGKRVRSDLICANAWHHRSDALSSLVVVGGIIGVFIGFPWLDAVAAIVVALMLAHIGLQFAWQSMRELVDTGLDNDEVEYIELLVARIDGVRAVHGLRTRYMGQDALVDLHVLVDPRLSVSEGHRISEAVRHRLVRDVSSVSEVLVHVDHEDPSWDDETAALPLRRRVERDLYEQWQDMAAADMIERIDLHYMEGKLEVEIHLPWDAETDGRALTEYFEDLASAAEQIDYVSACRVHLLGR